MAHQALCIANIVRDVDQLQRVEDSESLGLIHHVKGEDRPCRVHLFDRHFVAWVAGKAGMQHPPARLGNARLKKLAKRHRVLALLGGAKRKCLQPFHHHPGVERRQDRAGVALKRHQGFGNPFLAAADRAGENAPLPVHDLGRAVRDYVGAKFHRALQGRPGKGVVDHCGDAVRARQAAHIFQVHNIKRRVRWCFKEKHFGVGLDGRFPRGVLSAVDNCGFDPEAREKLVHQPATRPKRRARGHAVVARRQLAQQSRRHRGHA